MMNVQLHDRAQVFISCPSEESGARPTYIGTIERWLNNKVTLPDIKCHSKINLFILVRYYYLYVFLFFLYRKMFWPFFS